MKQANGHPASTARAKRPLLVVATRNVVDTLSPEALARVTAQLRQAMKTPDPDNPNLWSAKAEDRTVWGILDQRAGPKGEDVFTILFPEDY